MTCESCPCRAGRQLRSGQCDKPSFIQPAHRGAAGGTHRGGGCVASGPGGDRRCHGLDATGDPLSQFPDSPPTASTCPAALAWACPCPVLPRSRTKLLQSHPELTVFDVKCSLFGPPTHPPTHPSFSRSVLLSTRPPLIPHDCGPLRPRHRAVRSPCAHSCSCTSLKAALMTVVQVRD